MIRCRLFGHKFLGTFVEFRGGTKWESRVAVSFCVRCGAARLPVSFVEGRTAHLIAKDRAERNA